MIPLHRRHHRRYAPALAGATLAAVGLLTLLLALGPAPSVRPYELREPLVVTGAAAPPLQLLAVEVVGGDAPPLKPEGPLPDLEGEIGWELAPVDLPQDTMASPRRPALHHDFVAVTNQGIATVALFRMEPVFDTLPAGLPLHRVVVVKVRVSKEGKVVEAKVAKGLDHTHDQQALQAAWLYELASNENGERPDWVTLPYEFLDRP